MPVNQRFRYRNKFAEALFPRRQKGEEGSHTRGCGLLTGLVAPPPRVGQTPRPAIDPGGPAYENSPRDYLCLCLCLCLCLGVGGALLREEEGVLGDRQCRPLREAFLCGSGGLRQEGGRARPGCCTELPVLSQGAFLPPHPHPGQGTNGPTPLGPGLCIFMHNSGPFQRSDR